jgi:hypothetical protein
MLGGGESWLEDERVEAGRRALCPTDVLNRQNKFRLLILKKELR